jgi:hypothetical protein
MNRSRQPRRTPVTLSDSVDRNLNMYALAAGAAGVSLLALAPPAEAKVVYTKANEPIPNCRPKNQPCFELDLNHDHINDFTIPWYSNSANSSGSNGSSAFYIRPAEGQSKNMIWGTLSSTRLRIKDGRRGRRNSEHRREPVASALNAGASIGFNSFKFQPQHYAMFGWCDACGPYSSGGGVGQWADVQRKYLGLMFYVGGKIHYGWARLSSVKTGGWKLTGYAYESIPNKTIITGKSKGPDVMTFKPPTLGHLAAGSAAGNWSNKQTTKR